MFINELRFSSGYMECDDTTVYTFSSDVGDMLLQFVVNNQAKWSRTNSFVINENKTTEVIYFGHQFNKKNKIAHTVMNNRIVDCVNSFKFLGSLHFI
jgi:predicted GH43/DUF377 family glycosyl hydrolase